VPAVARRERLTPSYVAKLFGILRHAGLLESVRGKGGGFRLTRTAERVDVGSVLAALDAPLYCESFCHRYTGGEGQCVHDSDCSIRALWATIDGAVTEKLSQTTLKDLLRGERGMKDWLSSQA
jgi:Rrf2 family protein